MSRIYQTWYTDRKTGKRRNSKTHHIAFRDHLRRRQTIAGYPEKRKTEQMAIRLESLIRCRSMGEPLADDVNRWLMALDPARRERLAEMDILSPQMIYADKPLILHLEGSDTEPGFKQSLLAKGSTPGHVAKTVLRAKNIIEGCGFTSARNMTDPGAVTRVEVLLGKWRDEKRIGGRTLNYYVRDFKTFCRWLNATDRIPSPVMTSLAGVKNEDIESDDRRSLHVAELQYLLPVTASRPEVLGLSGEERAMLYWFAFETGLRPGQIRALKVEDFNLNSERPTVTGHARFVKRRKKHTQMLRPEMAEALRELFVTKVPTATALRMPTEYRAADMLRRDLKAARDAWIKEAPTEAERNERLRSDFLAEKDHEGQRAVFYSMRHGHGTALAAAGVVEKDIAASMHHASRTTTTRYLHAVRKDVEAAVALLPSVYRRKPKQEKGADHA